MKPYRSKPVKFIKKNAPGKGLLKVAGIIMIILGSAMLGILVNGVVILFTGTADRHIAFLLLGAGVCGIIQFPAGIVGVINCNKPEKATTCFVWGIIAVISAMICIVLISAEEISMDTFAEMFNIYMLLFTLPILYLIGAILNRKAALRAAEEVHL
jgi:hypothetical protein